MNEEVGDVPAFAPGCTPGDGRGLARNHPLWLMPKKSRL